MTFLGYYIGSKILDFILKAEVPIKTVRTETKYYYPYMKTVGINDDEKSITYSRFTK